MRDKSDACKNRDRKPDAQPRRAIDERRPVLIVDERYQRRYHRHAIPIAHVLGDALRGDPLSVREIGVLPPGRGAEVERGPLSDRTPYEHHTSRRVEEQKDDSGSAGGHAGRFR